MANTDSLEVEIPAELRNLMDRVGPRWADSGTVAENIALMCDAFAPVLARAPKANVSVTRDIPYGNESRQELDVFAPTAAVQKIAGAPVPIILFVHGGAFVNGDRNKNGEIYANVLYYFARNGFVGINIEYRLAPDNPYPSGTQDVALAIAWARRNAAAFGGDPDKIFLMGHSSGGAHAANYAYDRDFQPVGGPGVRGLVVISGRVRADVEPTNPNASKVIAYYGRDAALLEQRSAVNKVETSCVPTFIAYAEFENPLIDVHCLELASRIAKATGRSPRLAYMRGHNHTSIIAHMNTRDDFLGREIQAFITNTLKSTI